MDTVVEVLKFLEDTPGPSPWYLISHGPVFQDKKTEWLDAARSLNPVKSFLFKKKLIGKTFLKIDSVLKMIFDFQCYVKKISDTTFLVWYEQNDSNTNNPDTKIIINLFNIKKIRPIKLIYSPLNKMNLINKIYFSGESSGKIEIDKNFREGTCKLQVPDIMKNLDELLIYAHSTGDGLISNGFNQSNIALYIINFKNQTLEIVLQDWFNFGPFDFMYQAPSRVRRNEYTKEIYGDGIRISPFLLDETNKKIAKWFRE